MEYMVYIPILLSIIVLCIIQISSMGALEKQLAEQRRQLDRLSRLIESEMLADVDAASFLSAETMDRVLQLKREGNIIQAVHDVKKETGFSLKEAKEYVDGL